MVLLGVFAFWIGFGLIFVGLFVIGFALEMFGWLRVGCDVGGLWCVGFDF